MRRPPRSADSTTRRQYLKRVGGAGGAAGLTATAGCLGLRDELTSPPTAIGGTAASDVNSLSQEAFVEFVDRQREQYDDHGVWGMNGTEPDHGAEFAGAWTRRVGLDSDGSPVPQPDSASGLRAVVDAAAVAYRTPDRDGAGRQYYQLWLWAAARLAGEHDGGLLAATPSLRRVEVGLTLDGDVKMGPYSPGSDRTEGSVVVSATSPGVDGPAASFPLESGAIRVVPERTGFDDNAYAVAWEGDATDPRSVAGTCEASWGGDGEPSFDLSTRVAADRRRL